MVMEIKISSTCAIYNNAVYKNGEQLFTATGPGVTDVLIAIYKHLELGYNRFYKMDNLSKLGWLTTELLLKDSFDQNKYKPEDVGMVLSNANASLDSDLKYMASVAGIPSPALFVYTLPNIMMGEISIRHQFRGEAAFFVSENFDAGFVHQYVNNLLKNNIFEACICGWVDVLGDTYKSALFLVELGEGDVSFTAQNMEKIFNNDI